MKQEYLVSVIMPMYNSEKYIRQSIDSVIAQTYTNWELLIIDDGSTDLSLDITRQYSQKDPRIKFLCNDHHTGFPSTPRNVGLKNARGKYIAFLDSDDCWLPGKLDEQLSFFKDDIAIVYSNYKRITENGEVRRKTIFAPKETNYHKMLFSNVIGNSTAIYDREKIGTILFKDIHHEDYAMWLTALKTGCRAINTNTTNTLYRTRKSSISAKKIKIISWQWKIYREQEHIPIIPSAYYYLHYAVRGILKRI